MLVLFTNNPKEDPVVVDAHQIQALIPSGSQVIVQLVSGDIVKVEGWIEHVAQAWQKAIESPEAGLVFGPKGQSRAVWRKSDY